MFVLRIHVIVAFDDKAADFSGHDFVTFSIEPD